MFWLGGGEEVLGGCLARGGEKLFSWGGGGGGGGEGVGSLWGFIFEHNLLVFWGWVWLFLKALHYLYQGGADV